MYGIFRLYGRTTTTMMLASAPRPPPSFTYHSTNNNGTIIGNVEVFLPGNVLSLDCGMAAVPVEPTA
jgi:hypothetical protein